MVSSNSEDTEVPFQMFSVACASSGAVGTMRMLGADLTASDGWMESVMTSDYMTDLLTLSTAGGLITPWLI